MAQQLIALAPLAEDPQSQHPLNSLQPPVTSAPGLLTPSLASLNTKHTHGIQTFMQPEYPYI